MTIQIVSEKEVMGQSETLGASLGVPDRSSNCPCHLHVRVATLRHRTVIEIRNPVFCRHQRGILQKKQRNSGKTAVPVVLGLGFETKQEYGMLLWIVEFMWVLSE